MRGQEAVGRDWRRGIQGRKTGGTCRGVGGLRQYVADWGGCAAGIPPPGNCQRIDQPFGFGNIGAGKGAFLLRGVVKREIGAQCGEKRVPSGVGGNDGKKQGVCGGDEREARVILWGIFPGFPYGFLA